MSDASRPLRGQTPRQRRTAPILIVAIAVGCALATFAAMSGQIWLAAGALAQAVLAALALAAIDRPRFHRRPVEEGPSDTPPDILSVSPDPVVVVDPRVVVVDANAAARGIIPGLRARQPLSFALRAPEVLQAIRRSFASGATTTVEYVGRPPAEPVYAVHLCPLPAGGPGATSVVLFFRDLTAERRLESMRADFVATVSHELRTPLASLSGFIDTLRGPAKNDPVARDRFLDIMREQANRMTRLVDDLLQLSRVEMRAHVPPGGPIDLDPLVGHMIEILTPLARERGVTITRASEEGSHPVIGDRDELLRVVENLIENAIKYGGAGGEVEISIDRPEGGKWTEFQVRDNGPGIAPEHLPRLTERFYRVDIGESRAQGGTGLGLAIVKHIVMRHRGRLSIESELGHGAVFRVQLPTAAMPEITPA